MIISHSKKFIFIHIYKVAGSSIRSSLNRYAHLYTKKNRLLSGLKIYPKIFTSDFSQHSSALQVQQYIPSSIYRQYYKFAFVRNPWDWQVQRRSPGDRKRAYCTSRITEKHPGCLSSPTFRRHAPTCHDCPGCAAQTAHHHWR